jgi:hypothetical protein
MDYSVSLIHLSKDRPCAGLCLMLQ